MAVGLIGINGNKVGRETLNKEKSVETSRLVSVFFFPPWVHVRGCYYKGHLVFAEGEGMKRGQVIVRAGSGVNRWNKN